MDWYSMGLRIRRQRKLLHMTQEELAERSGICVSFMGHIERGTRHPGLETTILIANALETSLDVLIQDSLSEASHSRYQKAIGLLYRLNHMLEEQTPLFDGACIAKPLGNKAPCTEDDPVG